MRHSGGFTLVELLIAFTLIALISLLLFSGLRLGIRSWEGVENTAEQNAQQRVARNFLERALSQARSIQITLDAEPHLIFSGDRENLEFTAPLSEHVGIPGLYVLRLGLEDGEQNRLVLTRWLLNPEVLEGTGEIPEWEPFDGSKGLSWIGSSDDEDIAAGAFGTALLVASVEELDISYFGRGDNEDAEGLGGGLEGEWQQDWIDRSEPPLAVRIHLITPERTWPDMVVKLPSAATP